MRVSGDESRDAENSDGIFRESVGYMAKQFLFEVTTTVVRVNQVAGSIARHCVDRQVAPVEILSDRDIRGRVKEKAAIAGCGLSFSSRERIFFARIRVQEDGEVLADRLEACRLHLSRCRSHDAPVPLAHGQPKQFVTNRATDKVNFHTMILSSARNACSGS